MGGCRGVEELIIGFSSAPLSRLTSDGDELLGFINNIHFHRLAVRSWSIWYQWHMLTQKM